MTNGDVMSPTYDSGLIDRLVREAREDDERMEVKPWIVEDDELYSDSIKHGTIQLAGFTQYTGEECQQGIARTRNNLSAMADQLEAARREIDSLRTATEVAQRAAERRGAERDLLRAVFYAAERWNGVTSPLFRDHDALSAAIDAYRAAKGKT